MDTTLSEWLLVALILFSLVIEAVLHRLEHWITRRHHHLVSVVRVLYRELMILGLVSFIFILFETIRKPTGTVILSFEFAHVFIFLFAVFYALVVLSSMFTSLRLSARWKRMERMDVVNYLNVKNQYTNLRRVVLRRHGAIWRTFWWFPNIAKLFRYMGLHEIITFHDIRFQFIYYRDLPEDFRFSSFLRKIKSITFIDLVESHWSHYLIFLTIILADIMRRYIAHASSSKTGARAGSATDNPTDNDSRKSDFNTLESVFVISAAILLAFFAQVLAVKIRRVYWELTKHPRLYYEGVEPEAFEEELEKAVRTRTEQSLSRDEPRTKSASISEPVDTGNEADDEGLPLNDHVSRPENELLDPMDLPPLSTTLPGPSKNTGHSATHEDRSAVMAPTTSVRGSNSSDRQRLPGAPIRAMGTSSPLSQRHSIDRTRPPGLPFDPPERPITDFQPVRPDYHRPTSLDVPEDDFEQTVVRHSLDVPRSVGASKAITVSNSTGASIALAAVEAAKRRAALGVTSGGDDGSPPPSSYRRSLDTDRPFLHYRRSLDIDRPGIVNKLSPRLLSSRSSRRGSIDDEYRRISLDSRYLRPGGRRVSIEMAVVMPRDEIAARFEGDSKQVNGSGETEVNSSRSVGSYKIAKNKDQETPQTDTEQQKPKARIRFSDESLTVRDVTVNVGSNETEINAEIEVNLADDSALETDKRAAISKEALNPTILRNLEHQRIAQRTTPTKYPKWVIKIAPRLGRVASPVEKLFWFGSHRFFLWCVEFVLFFSTVLLAAASAGLSLLPLSGKRIGALNIVSLLLAALSLMFILLKTAGIMKRYIFIIHNASLIPEVVAIEAIHNVKKKRVVQDEESSTSGSDTDREDVDVARERRRRLGTFFRREAEIGNVPGIDGERRGSRSSRDSMFRRRWKRRIASRRRRFGFASSNAKNDSTAETFPSNQAIVRDTAGSESDVAKEPEQISPPTDVVPKASEIAVQSSTMNGPYSNMTETSTLPATETR